MVTITFVGGEWILEGNNTSVCICDCLESCLSVMDHNVSRLPCLCSIVMTANGGTAQAL